MDSTIAKSDLDTIVRCYSATKFYLYQAPLCDGNTHFIAFQAHEIVVQVPLILYPQTCNVEWTVQWNLTVNNFNI